MRLDLAFRGSKDLEAVWDMQLSVLGVGRVMMDGDGGGAVDEAENGVEDCMQCENCPARAIIDHPLCSWVAAAGKVAVECCRISSRQLTFKASLLISPLS